MCAMRLQNHSQTATKETPFALTFGYEVVVPVEVRMGTHRTKYLNLDLLAVKREIASRKVVEYQQKVACYYNWNVQVRQFRSGV